ncbi:MAG: hypothetical protein GEU73_08815 [Chloroflexi bacterium]|nr:hypothetical protein [Chloroflexota bacterium]
MCGGDGNTPPSPTIVEPAQTLLYVVGDTIQFSGSATDPEDGSIPADGLSWTVLLHHCPGGDCHLHQLTSPPDGAGGSFDVPDHGDETYFEIALTATDSGGAKATTSVAIHPKTVQLTLESSVSGLDLVYGGSRGPAPIVVTTVAGSSHTISAPSPQGPYVFASWSDSGAQQHNITVGTDDTVYTATFTCQGATYCLSDLDWTVVSNGWGPPERDTSNGEADPGDGQTLTINGATFAKGLGVHAHSDIRLPLGPTCTNFLAQVGVDDEVGSLGSVEFQVWADGTLLYASGVMTGSSTTQSVTVDVAGRGELQLVVTDGGDGIDYDHADWANARITC